MSVPIRVLLFMHEGPNFSISQSTTPAGFTAGYGRREETLILFRESSLVKVGNDANSYTIT